MYRNPALAAALCGLLIATACSESSTPPTSPGGPAPVAAVQVSPGTTNLPIGQSQQLAVALADAAGRPVSGRQVTWSATPAHVVEVSQSGLVTALANGSATITATSEGKSGTATVTVAAAISSVEVVMALDTIEAYETQNLEVILRDADGGVITGRQVTWSTSDPTIATVNPQTGVLTGIDRGTVTVTATSEGKSGTASRVVVILYRSVSAGSMHACDIASGGIAWCWGLNGKQGRIGSPQLADDAFSAVPVRVPGDHRFAQLETYGSTTCGVTVQGAAYCWGSNSWGALGTGSSSSAPSYTPVAVAGGHTFKQIAAGPAHFCGLTTAGKVYCWGANGSGELGNGLRTYSSTPVQGVPNLTFTALTAGAEYTCGIATDGKSYCWGYSGMGNLGGGTPISYGNTYSLTPVVVAGGHNFQKITAGQLHTCGLTYTGQGHCWGRDGGRLGTGNAGDTSTPAAISGGLTFKSLSAGFTHTCGVTSTDDVYCWGANGNGQLGVNLVNGSTVPVAVAGGLKVAEVSAANIATGSATYTCAISVDRLTTYCWGRNDVGQLGNGATTTAAAVNHTPTIVQTQKPL